ncbi:MAG: pyridoxamine 5'-phosphate oxidase family protein [Hyphomicrobium sp.]
MPQPSLPQMVRELVRGFDRASLATVLAGENWPYASLVLVALDHDLSPILLMSDLALHSKAIAADDRVSLLFDGTAGLDQPLTGPRVTLLGRATRSDDARPQAAFPRAPSRCGNVCRIWRFRLLPSGARTCSSGGRLRQNQLAVGGRASARAHRRTCRGRTGDRGPYERGSCRCGPALCDQAARPAE